MDAFLAHAIVEPTGATPGDSAEARAAKALGVQLLGLAGERPMARTWRARTADGQARALVIIAETATAAEREVFGASAQRLVTAGRLEGVVRVHAVTRGLDAFASDLWTTGCASDLPTLQWPPRRRLEFIRRVAQALDALHGAGIFHGCLCLDNVLLDDDLQPVLAEAGMVSLHRPATPSPPPGVQERAGARGMDPAGLSRYLAFAAPETRRGEAPDARSDIWSLGQLIEKLVAESEVPRLYEVVNRCVATVSHLRYASASDLVAAIDKILVALPEGATSASPRRAAQGDGGGPPPPPRRSHHGERIGRAGAAPSETVRERQLSLSDASRASAAGVASSRPALWPALVGSVLISTAMAAAFVVGAQTETARPLFFGMVVGGVALVVWAVPIPSGRARLAARIALVLSVAGLAAAADPIAWMLRAGAVRRLGGGEAARHAALTEIIDLGRDFRGMSLSGFDLSGLDLTAADLRRADLSHADLSGCRLWSAQIEGASLDRARLVRADLEETALGAARHAETAECDAATRLPRGWRCRAGKVARD